MSIPLGLGLSISKTPTHRLLSFEEPLSEINRDIWRRLVLEQPEHAQDPEHGVVSILFADVDDVLRRCGINFGQNIAQRLLDRNLCTHRYYLDAVFYAILPARVVPQRFDRIL
jgi:hypothetical protein